MAQGEYKAGEPIEVTYQATGATPNLTDVQMDVYDEGGVLVAGQSGVMTEIETDTGRYAKTFTPAEEGKWRVMVDSGSKKGKMVRDYDVVGHNIDAVGDAVAIVDGIVDDVKIKTENLPDDPASATGVAGVGDAVALLNDLSAAEVDTVLENHDVAKKSELDAAQSAIQGTDNDTLKDLSDQMDGIVTDAPPMIG